MKQCGKCHRQFGDGDAFCPFDGATLAPAAPHAARTAAEPGPPAAAAAAAGPPPPAPPLDGYDALIGTTLDARYRIERRLGEGGMGVVFLARHIVIEKPVAVKVLKREVARDRSVVRRFVQEAKAASSIGHPNIVDVTDFGTTPDGTTYSVMEYVPGQTLHDVIQAEQRLPPSRAVAIAAQIGRALGAAHRKGIVHRDLKPENIFLVETDTARDVVKVVDFGIAKVTSVRPDPTVSPRLTRQGTVFGTPEYMPPEQASGQPDADHRVDIYALGITLWEMLVGRVPLKGDSLLRTLTLQIIERIPTPSEAEPALDLPAELERAIDRALAKNRDDRFASMDAFVTALEHAVAGLPAPRGASEPFAAQRSPHQPTLIPAESPDTVPEPSPPGLAGEPAFAGGAAKVLRRLDTVGEIPPGAVPARRNALAFAALACAVLAGIGTAIALWPRDEPAREARADAGPDAHPTPLPAPAVTPGDAAATPAATRTDAAAPAPPASRPPLRRRPTPGVDHAILVETRPRGGTLYMPDGAYGGSDGTTLTRVSGTRLDVTCRFPGHAPGRASLYFDGVMTMAICRMARTKRCIPGVKNPFDDCATEPGPDR